MCRPSFSHRRGSVGARALGSLYRPPPTPICMYHKYSYKYSIQVERRYCTPQFGDQGERHYLGIFRLFLMMQPPIGSVISSLRHVRILFCALFIGSQTCLKMACDTLLSFVPSPTLSRSLARLVNKVTL